MGGLPRQHLLGQVVDYEAMAAGERMHEPREVAAVAHRQRGELQPGDPALGAFLQRRDIGRGQRQPHDLGKKRSRFLGCEAQVGGA